MKVEAMSNSALVCDLHLHSTNSDGLESAETVIKRAAAAGLAAMSITDHSGVTFDESLGARATAHGVALVPGIEISTRHHANRYHVLAYGPGVLDREFQLFAFQPTRLKNKVYGMVLQELRAGGARVPADEELLAGIDGDGLPAHPGTWMLGSTRIAQHLARASASDPEIVRQQVRSRYDELKVREVDRYVMTEDAIAWARRVGALPVLAHPFWECSSGENSWASVVEHMGHFTTLGLGGAEVSSRHDSPATEEARRHTVRQLGLVPFRSSDYHANGKTTVGQFPMPLVDLVEAADRAGVDLGTPLRTTL